MPKNDYIVGLGDDDEPAGEFTGEDCVVYLKFVSEMKARFDPKRLLCESETCKYQDNPDYDNRRWH